MALYPQLLGFDETIDNKEVLAGIVSTAIQKGTPIIGYYGLPYINHMFGDIQMAARIEKCREGENEYFELKGADVHVAGNSVWNVTILSPGADTNDPLARCPLIKCPDGSGAVPINIINADVLPSFQENDKVSLQVVGIAEGIDYFADEDEYKNSVPEANNLNRLMLGDGVIFPIGLLGRPVGIPGNPALPIDLVTVKGTVEYFNKLSFKLTNEIEYHLMRCVINTKYGLLEIVHPYDYVTEEQSFNLRRGAVAVFIGYLSGDAAIYEYGEGIIKDEEHNLMLLKDVICSGAVRRMQSVLADNVTCRTEKDGSIITGRNAVSNWFAKLWETHRNNITAVTSSLVKFTACNGGVFEPGKRLLAISYEKVGAFDAHIFINTDEDGNICEITVGGAGNCIIEPDARYAQENICWENTPPQYVAAPILKRAKLNGIVGRDVPYEDILQNFYEKSFNDNIDGILDALPKEIKNPDELFKNIFGYLFAKSIECKYVSGMVTIPGQSTPACACDPQNAFDGIILGAVDQKRQKKLEDALKFGRSFYEDMKFFHENVERGTLFDPRFWVLLRQALLTVQAVGAAYSDMCMANGGDGIVS